VVGLILMQQDLRALAVETQSGVIAVLAGATVWMIPPVVLCVGLLMVSTVRYPHMVNRYLRGRRSVGRLVALIAALLLLVVAHRYVLGVALLGYALLTPITYLIGRRRTLAAKAALAHSAAPQERPQRSP
jgi:phosphatidylserine synthase